MKDPMKAAKLVSAISAYMQAPIIFVCSAGLCIGLALYLKSKFNLPDYTVVIGIVLGVLSGFYGMFRHLWMIMKFNEKNKKEQDNVK